MTGASDPPDSGLSEQLSDRQVDIIRATYRLIGDRGVDRVSLQEVADEAGVSKALLFYYFESKESLILATMRWVLSRVAERIRRGVAAAGTAEEKALAMIDVIFAGPEANRRFYVAYLDLVDHALRLDDFSNLSATFRSIVNALYADVVSLGVREGAFRADDVEEAATTLRAIVDGLFLQWMQEDDRAATHPRYREMCKRAVLAYLRSGTDGPPEVSGRRPPAGRRSRR